MEKPAIVLVHGFWGGASHWNNVINALKAQGYFDVYAVENPPVKISMNYCSIFSKI
ncbi:esterase/lipase family protein [Avibacterium avium]|uniref:esterase/lipase family protein n=1 Tax=Avibacterium avium TaxID=751 RepID=UPI003BF7CF85